MSSCEEEGHHNDLATLFLSSSHHTIVNLFSLGKGAGQAYLQYFTPGSLALFTTCYLVLMSIGAGVAIPGGMFMPSMMVSEQGQQGEGRGGRGQGQPPKARLVVGTKGRGGEEEQGHEGCDCVTLGCGFVEQGVWNCGWAQACCFVLQP
jgi:hypothetical protein